MLLRWLSVIWVAALISPVDFTSADELPETSLFTAGMERHGGFVDAYWDSSAGRVFLDLSHFGDDFLFLTALESGLGSNPVGLDRGQVGEAVVCRWRMVGRRVFLEQQNLKFRADTAINAERRAVGDSFAPSILWAGEIVAQEGSSRLVDVTSLVVSDRHGISDALKSAGQGEYSLSADRSLPLAESIESFPNNIELPALLTFTSTAAGSEVSAVAANGKSFSVRQRLSLISLPEPGFQTRPFDPRIGSFEVAYADYAAPLDQSIFKQLMVRHRLELDDQGNVVEPIVYYVDSAAPEPVRSALLEGASWWGQAFEAAGFPGGFRVEIAPDDMDPLDIRFNFIQWVHRQTRGWSYGSTVIDPRTGEIIKGHVSLGSLRVRQDRLLTENMLIGRNAKPGSACGMVFPETHMAIENILGQQIVGRERATEISLARIRQLAAHEVGHTLGIAHNFAASTYGERASVMDYPAPKFRLDADNQIDSSDAYAVGMGIWDLRTIDYMYREFTDDQSWQSYVKLRLSDDIRDGIQYISDADARPLGGAHPAAHLWDNGSDPIAELQTILDVRRVAMQNFDARVLLDGEPQGELVRAFTPLYFYHRYQAEAVAKLIGGVDYAYSLPGDANASATPVSVDVQQRAVEALLQTLSAENLTISNDILRLLIPPSIRTAWANEQPQGFTGPVFDPLAAAETSAAMTVNAMLHPARAARLTTQGDTMEGHPGLDLVLNPLVELVAKSMVSSENAKEDAIARRVAGTIVNAMLDLVANDAAREDVRALVRLRLQNIVTICRLAAPSELKSGPEREWMADKIERFLARPDVSVQKTDQLPPPPGSPIGS